MLIQYWEESGLHSIKVWNLAARRCLFFSTHELYFSLAVYIFNLYYIFSLMHKNWIIYYCFINMYIRILIKWGYNDNPDRKKLSADDRFSDSISPRLIGNLILLPVVNDSMFDYDFVFDRSHFLPIAVFNRIFSISGIMILP